MKLLHRCFHLDRRLRYPPQDRFGRLEQMTALLASGAATTTCVEYANWHTYNGELRYTARTCFSA